MLPPDDVSVLKLSYKDPNYETPSHSFAQLDSFPQNYGGNGIEGNDLYRGENDGLMTNTGGTRGRDEM